MSFITPSEAKTMIKTYKEQRPGLLKEEIPVNVLPLNITFTKHEISRLLEQTDAASLRVYFGMSPEAAKLEGETQGIINLVLMAANDNEEDIIDPVNPLIVDHGVRCPAVCPPASDLNP